MRISLIAAMARNRVIGRDNALPWHLPADLEHFKRTTSGHTVIMGRRTWESVGTPLPDRRCIVVSRDPDYRAEGATVARSLEHALQLARVAGEGEVFVLGGAEIYALALPQADRLHLTVIDDDVEGDTYFPDVDLSEWNLVNERHHETDDRHAHAFTIRTYERKEKKGSDPILSR